MTLTPLATEADLPAAWIGEDTRQAIQIASAAVRDAAGCAITVETSTVTVPGGESTLLRLPGPILAVTAVSIDGVAVTDYTVLAEGLWRRGGWGWGPMPVTVAYTHGHAQVPADIVDLTAQLAIAWMQHQAGGGGSTAGLTSVSIDDARETYTQGFADAVSPVFIPPATRQWLAARFGGGPTVVRSA